MSADTRAGGRIFMLQRFSHLVFTAALLAPGIAQAQVVGSITGTVTDQSGRPLAGVRLVARSETQIGGGRAAYTNDDGFYRVPGLQPGIFEVRATAVKLKAVVQKDVHVGVNAPAEVDVVMEVETAIEEVKIIERAPVVSTTSAAVKEVFDADFVDGLPMAKRTGYGGFIRDTVPGAAEGGPNPAIGDWTARVRGANNAQNAIMLEGFLVNGQKVTLNSLAAMEVQTAGAGAENAGSPGAVVNMVTQSGSNKYVLDVTAWHEDSRLRLFLDRTDPGNKVMNTFFNPAFSGPILKDKLWFYLNTESRISPTDRDTDPNPTGIIDPTPPPRYYWNVRGTLKLTWQVNPRNKVQSFTLLNREGWANYREGYDVAREAQMRRNWFDYFTGVTWESLLTDQLFFKSQLGFQRFFRQERPELCETESSCLDIMPQEQLFPRRIFTANYDRVDQLADSSIEFTNTLEWFAHHRWLGEHDVKAVARYISRIYETTAGVPGDAKEIFNGPDPARRQDFYSDDPRVDQPRHGYWVRASSGFRFSNSLSDTMRVTRYLTITPGLALTIDKADSNMVGNVISQADVTPHLAVAWDVGHDGRTVLRGSHNQYVDTDAVRIARHALDDGVMRECKWNPTTGKYDVDCRYSGGLTGRTVGLPCGPTGFNPDGTRCQGKLGTPRTLEYTLGGEREIAPGVGLGVDFIYRSFHNPYERSETNRIWNGSGSALSTLGGYRSGRAETVVDLNTPSQAGRRYTAVTASLKKREGALKITASYTWSRLEGNVPGEEDNEFGDIPGRNPYLWGYLPYDRRHEVRTSATYQVNRWFSAGVNYNYYSGSPYSRKFFNAETGKFEDYRASTGVNPGANLNDPTDDRPLRTPDIQQLHLQFRAHLKPLLGINLETYLDVINALALRTTSAVYVEDGPSFGQPSARLDPLRLRLGVRFRY
jgi:hypothetical protein